VLDDTEPSQKKSKEDTDTGVSEPQKVKKKKKKKKLTLKFDPPAVDEVKQPTDYKVLGNEDQFRRSKTKRVLPHWLKTPSVVSVDLKNLKNTVDSIPQLDKNIVNNLKNNGITHFFPGKLCSKSKNQRMCKNVRSKNETCMLIGIYVSANDHAIAFLYAIFYS